MDLVLGRFGDPALLVLLSRAGFRVSRVRLVVNRVLARPRQCELALLELLASLALELRHGLRQASEGRRRYDAGSV